MNQALHAQRVGVLADQQRWLLKEVSLDVRYGEILAVVGPNGAGKSTLLAALAGDLEPTTGEVIVEDRPIRAIKPKELARIRAVLPQQTNIQFAFTAREIVSMGVGKGNITDDQSIIDASLRRVDAGHLATRVFPSLSVGEQARVTLARILAQQTPILLLDEPTAALDLRHQQLVMEIAQSLAADGAAVVIILHDLNLAAAYADRIAILSKGVLESIGTPWQTLTRSTLEHVFECSVEVVGHPGQNCPLVLPQMNRQPRLEPSIAGPGA